MRAAVAEADRAEKEGLPLPLEVDVRGARCSLAAWRGVAWCLVWCDERCDFACTSRCVSGVVALHQRERERNGGGDAHPADGVTEGGRRDVETGTGPGRGVIEKSKGQYLAGKWGEWELCKKLPGDSVSCVHNARGVGRKYILRAGEGS